MSSLQVSSGKKVSARSVAVQALVRIDEGAYSNILLPAMLSETNLAESDRKFVTQLVYGSTRMRKTCDFTIDNFLKGKSIDALEPEVRNALRIGTFQLLFLDTPAHAAVGETVDLVPHRAKGLVNAVLRKISTAEKLDYPDLATKFSYPEWIVQSLIKDWGFDKTADALEAMNHAAQTHSREDGYVQDVASQLVVESIPIRAGDLLFDICAAPGGKATSLVSRGARVVACDLNPKRTALISENARRLDYDLPVLVADGCAMPFRDGAADHVLVDAPCSGLGTLRRRPDARWNIDAGAPERLAKLQLRLLESSSRLLKQGGILTYSVCTLVKAEGVSILNSFLDSNTDFELMQSLPLDPRWQVSDNVNYLWPGETDGMMMFQLKKLA